MPDDEVPESLALARKGKAQIPRHIETSGSSALGARCGATGGGSDQTTAYAL